MNSILSPIYSVDDGSPPQHVSTLEVSSPWPNADVSFHWTNHDYPHLHTHQYWELLILFRGKLRHTINGCSHTIEPNQAYLIRPDDCHKLESCGNDPVIILNFMAKKEYMQKLFAIYSDELMQQILCAPNPSVVLDKSAITHFTSETQALQYNKNIPIQDKYFRCKVLFLDLISSLIKQQPFLVDHYPRWLNNLLIAISSSDYSDQSIREILSQCEYSYSRLIYLFKQYMGCTIIDYVSSQRLEHATYYLKHTNMRMIDIASAIGYDSVSHFNHMFKKHFGITPTQYRNNYCNEAPPPAKEVQ